MTSAEGTGRAPSQGNGGVGRLVGGLLLVLLGTGGLWLVESRSSRAVVSYADAVGRAHTVTSGEVDPANDGKLVHLSGTARAATPVQDAEFGMSAPALVLVRTVEMYLWRETRGTKTVFGNTTATYSHALAWSDHPIDSSGFNGEPGTYLNPVMPARRKVVMAADASLGAFRLSVSDLVAITDSSYTPIAVRADALPGFRKALRGKVQLADGVVYVGDDPSQPKLGDLRIGYRTLGYGPITVLARQDGVGFGVGLTDTGRPFHFVMTGEVTPAELVAPARTSVRGWAWLGRALTILLLGFGFTLLLPLLRTEFGTWPWLGVIVRAQSVVAAPFLSAFVATPIVVAYWIRVEPAFSIYAASAGIVAMAMLGWLARSPEGQ